MEVFTYILVYFCIGFLLSKLSNYIYVNKCLTPSLDKFEISECKKTAIFMSNLCLFFWPVALLTALIVIFYEMLNEKFSFTLTKKDLAKFERKEKEL